jgi:hypothetical protein
LTVALRLSLPAGRKALNGHVPPIFTKTKPGFNMHTPQEIGIDDFQASRSPTKVYRTAPLKGLSAIQKKALSRLEIADLRSVVNHYDTFLKTFMTQSEKVDLIRYVGTL